MFYGKITKIHLVNFLDDLWEGIDLKEWQEVIPSVVGHKPYLPESLEDAELHAETFRGNDQLLAYELVQYPELHDKMISIVNFIIHINKRRNMWALYDDEEYPGASFIFALALQDKKYLELYADFLLSIEVKYAISGRENPQKIPIDHSFKYFGYDIITQIKKWDWCPETYHLLFAYWFFDDKEKESVLEYLSRTGFPVDLKEETNYRHFVESLAQILKKSNFSEEDKQGKYLDLFKELASKYIIVDSNETAESLHVCYQDIIENRQPVVKLKEIIEEIEEIEI